MIIKVYLRYRPIKRIEHAFLKLRICNSNMLYNSIKFIFFILIIKMIKIIAKIY